MGGDKMFGVIAGRERQAQKWTIKKRRRKLNAELMPEASVAFRYTKGHLTFRKKQGLHLVPRVPER